MHKGPQTDSFVDFSRDSIHARVLAGIDLPNGFYNLLFCGREVQLVKDWSLWNQVQGVGVDCGGPVQQGAEMLFPSSIYVVPLEWWSHQQT